MPTIKHFSNSLSQTDTTILQDIQTVTNYLAQKYNVKCYVVGDAVCDERHKRIKGSK